MKKENHTNKVTTKRKPPIRKKRKMAEVISLEEYRLKNII